MSKNPGYVWNDPIYGNKIHATLKGSAWDSVDYTAVSALLGDDEMLTCVSLSVYYDFTILVDQY